MSNVLTKLGNSQQVRMLRQTAKMTYAPLSKLMAKSGPELLIGAGIAGGIMTVALAIHATTKLEKTVDEIQQDVALVKERKEAGSATSKDLTRVYVRSTVKIVKLYAPTITMGVASACFVLGAHDMMKKRNAALAAAYKALETTFETYKKRVVEEFGEEKDEQYRLGLREEKKEDPETGKNETILVFDPSVMSQYSRIFDEYNTRYNAAPGHNLVWLKAMQNYFNDLLHTRGHVFLNEVYNELGFQPIQAGQAVGWILGADEPNYVDFGIYDLDNPRKKLFINGLEQSILLNFNLSGVIINRIAS